jgi:hypothetical protein
MRKTVVASIIALTMGVGGGVGIAAQLGSVEGVRNFVCGA